MSLRLDQPLAERLIDIEPLGGADALAEQIANDLSVHRWSRADRDVRRMFVLWGDRRTRHEPLALRFGNQNIEKKLSGAFHHRIYTRKKLFIAGEFVMIPQMCAEPGAPGGPEAPEWTIDRSGLPPKISIVMTDPSASAVVNTRRSRLTPTPIATGARDIQTSWSFPPASSSSAC